MLIYVIIKDHYYKICPLLYFYAFMVEKTGCLPDLLYTLSHTVICIFIHVGETCLQLDTNSYCQTANQNYTTIQIIRASYT